MRCDYGLVGIGQAAAHYGVSVVTMRRWEREKRLSPTSRTLGGHRRYRLDGDEDRFSVGYARVSGSDQKADLIRQKDFLSPHCDDVIGDVGDAVKRVVKIARQHNVGVGIEKLDFSRKKQALKETSNKRHRTMLSAFAYNMVLSLIERRCYREGLPCKAVNPAMTSIIGMFK